MKQENNIVYRKMVEEDIDNVYEVIKDTFFEFIAQDYSREGIDEFMKYASKENLLERFKRGNISIVSEDNNRIMGLIEMRDLTHISLYFVDKNYKGKGIGKNLYKKAMESIKKIKNDIKEVTVNSSPYAVEVYEKLGFEKVKEQMEVNGIKFIPMKAIV